MEQHVREVVPDVFGVAALASIVSALGLDWRSDAAIGPAASGFLDDATRSYVTPFGGGSRRWRWAGRSSGLGAAPRHVR